MLGDAGTASLFFPLVVSGKQKNEKPRKNAPISIYGFPGAEKVLFLLYSDR